MATQTQSVSKELLDFESSLENLVEDLVADLGEEPKKPAKVAKKAKAVVARKKKPAAGIEKYGTQQMQATYVEICRNSLSPLTRYTKAIHAGVLSKDLIEVSLLIVQPLVRKTKQVGLQQEARKLRSLQVVLQEIQKSKSSKITKRQRDSLFEAYWPVHETFALDMRGHSLAVANLLSFYKKMKRSSRVNQADIRKLFAIGIPSLTMIRKSSLDDLTSLSGIARTKIQKIRKLAREFQLEWYLA